MAGLTLEPYAAVQRWKFGQPSQGLAPETLLSGYLQALARRCAEAGGVIGHIKALATFSGEGFWRANIVAAHLPIDTEGRIPSDCSTLDLTLNVLVYGLTRGELEQMVDRAARFITQPWNVRAAYQPIDPALSDTTSGGL